MNNPLSVPNLKYKTTFCNNWRNGQFCIKTVNCFFAHGQEELRTLEDNQALIANRNKESIFHESVQNYKTIFCKFFSKGQCKLGEACTFAHQRKEKRAKIQVEPEHNYGLYEPYLNYGQAYGIPTYQPCFYQNFPMQFNFEYVEADAPAQNLKTSIQTAADSHEDSESERQIYDVMPHIEEGQQIIIQEKCNKILILQAQKEQ